MSHLDAPKMTVDSTGKEILVRSEGASGASFVRLKDSGRFQAAQGGKYAFVDPITFDEIPVSSLRQDGETLIVLLDDGRIIKIDKFFDVDSAGRPRPVANLVNGSDLGADAVENGFAEPRGTEPSLN